MTEHTRILVPEERSLLERAAPRFAFAAPPVPTLPEAIRPAPIRPVSVVPVSAAPVRAAAPAPFAPVPFDPAPSQPFAGARATRSIASIYAHRASSSPATR